MKYEEDSSYKYGSEERYQKDNHTLHRARTNYLLTKLIPSHLSMCVGGAKWVYGIKEVQSKNTCDIGQNRSCALGDFIHNI